MDELYWPAKKHESNHIQHLWDELERHLWARTYHPASVLDLTYALMSEWKFISAARFNIWRKDWNQESEGGLQSSREIFMVFTRSHFGCSHALRVRWKERVRARVCVCLSFSLFLCHTQGDSGTLLQDIQLTTASWSGSTHTHLHTHAHTQKKPKIHTHTHTDTHRHIPTQTLSPLSWIY